MERPSSSTKLSFARDVHSHLQAGPQSFVLLDAARSPGVLHWLSDAGLSAVGLYDGTSAGQFGHVAPYLAQLDAASTHTGRLLENSWGDAWGIYLFSDASLEELRAHFRRFLYVQMPDGAMVYFRFYDPRVLRDFLPAFSPEEKTTFFGPVNAFLVEGPDGQIFRFEKV